MCFIPDKISAVGAVGWLSQVGGHELVSVDLMDASPHGALTPARTDPLPEHSLLILIGSGSCQMNKLKFINKKSEFRTCVCVGVCVCLSVTSVLLPELVSTNKRYLHHVA